MIDRIWWKAPKDELRTIEETFRCLKCQRIFKKRRKACHLEEDD